jgi:hypothetical protein
MQRSSLTKDIYDVNYFRQLLKQNVVWVVTNVFLPQEFVFMKTIEFPFALRKPGKRFLFFGSHFTDLFAVTCSDAEYTWRKVKRLWGQNMHTAKKNLVHSLRYLPFKFRVTKDF